MKFAPDNLNYTPIPLWKRVLSFAEAFWKRLVEYADHSPKESGAFGKNMSIQADQVYYSFLVRCWFIPPATADEVLTWRFELQEVSAESQTHRFSDFQQLQTFMAAKLTAVAADSKQDNDKEES